MICWCGNEFEPLKPNQVNCSMRCKNIAAQRRWRAKKPPRPVAVNCKCGAALPVSPTSGPIPTMCAECRRQHNIERKRRTRAAVKVERVPVQRKTKRGCLFGCPVCKEQG